MNDKPAENPEAPTYQNFLSAAMEFLAARPGASVIMVVESEKGFETFTNRSPIWSYGATKAGALQIKGMMLTALQSNDPRKEQFEREEHERMMASVKRDKEKAN